MNEESSVYEIGFHIAPTADEALVAKTVDKIKKAIEDNEGAIVSEEAPRETHLAYAIDKFDKAYFGWVKFQMDGVKVENLNKFVKTLSEILRFIIVKTSRENMVHYHKMAASKEEGAEVKPVSAEEIDKSIEELVIE